MFHCIPGRAAIVILAVLCGLAGCGEQDLYEPPGAPVRIVGSVPLPSVNEGVDVLGTWAFVAAGQAGLHVVDFADPAHPVLVKTINTTKYAEDIQVVRTFAGYDLRDIALVVEGTEGITSYDITDPANAWDFEQGTTAVDGQRICVVEPEDPDEPYLVFLADSWKGIRIFASAPAIPGLLNYTGVFTVNGTNGYARGLAFKDDYVYVADDEMGLAVIDARNIVLGSVELVSWADSPGNAEDVAIEGDCAFVAIGTEGLVVYRIDGPAPPVRLSHMDLSGYSRNIEVRDGLAVIAAAGGGVHFIDVRQPTRPEYLGTVNTTYATDVALADGGQVLVSDREDGLVVLGGRAPFADRGPPLAVTSLAAAPYSTTVITLSWYATGDDGMLGRAAACEVRQAAAPILDEAAWAAATPVPDPPQPVAPGLEQTFLVTGLSPGEEYHFAVRMSDDEGRTSPLGNSAAAVTFSGIVLADGRVDAEYGTVAMTYTYEVTYIFEQAPTVAEAIIDGTAHTMTHVSGEHATGALYRYATTLVVGEHDYGFHFEGPEGALADLPAVPGPVVGVEAFLMGSPVTELGRQADEIQHGVAFSHQIVAAPHEVTQSEWTALGLANPVLDLENAARFLGDDRPVVNINWLEAVDYCNLLSDDQGLTRAYAVDGPNVTWDPAADGWRLPTEAEWEFLCRGGTETAFAGGGITEPGCLFDPVLDAYGWYYHNADNATHDVELKAANPLGLYDVHGNVREWCWDHYGELGEDAVLDPSGPVAGFERIVRGGSWFYCADECRSAARGHFYPVSADDTIGLRPVRTVFAR